MNDKPKFSGEVFDPSKPSVDWKLNPTNPVPESADQALIQMVKNIWASDMEHHNPLDLWLQAMKHVRELTGKSLKEAKWFMECEVGWFLQDASKNTEVWYRNKYHKS
jgi:hypothetical protein